MEPNLPRYDDEIDLFELIQTIWEGKIWIILATAVATCLGGLYIIATPTIYEVTVKPTIHADADADADAKIVKQFTQHSNLQWDITANKKSHSLTLETGAPESAETYMAALEKSAQIATAQLIQSKKDELAQISDLSPALLGTEVVAKTVLSNQRFLNSFETMGHKAIEFSEPTIQVKAPKTNLIIALSFVLGGMVGVLGILIRSAYRNRVRQQQS